MATIRPIRVPRPEPIGIEAHAMDNLLYIRRTMERAGSFTAVPGIGGIVMGISALAAAALASLYSRPEQQVAVWLIEAVVASAIGLLGAAQKARRANDSLLSAPGKKFLAGFVPPLTVGILLTTAALYSGFVPALPGIWLLLYGTGVVSGGAASVRVVPIMGLCFMAFGGAALFIPSAFGNLMLAAGFGGLHIVFGSIITVKYGG